MVRSYIKDHLWQTHQFTGKPEAYDHFRKSLLIMEVRSKETGELVSDHIWLQESPKIVSQERIEFTATCVWYKRNQNTQDYGLRFMGATFGSQNDRAEAVNLQHY